MSLDSAVAADHKSAQEPLIGLAAPRTEVGVLARDSLRRLEDFLVDDGRNPDLNPLFGRSQFVARTSSASSRRQRLVAVVERAAHVGRIAEHLAEAGD